MSSEQNDSASDHRNEPLGPPAVTTELREAVTMPAPTAWPFTLALGVMLVSSGLVLNGFFSALGLALVAIAVGGWTRELLPGEGEEVIPWAPPAERAKPIRPSPHPVASQRLGVSVNRMELPGAVRPYTAGLTGGAFGGVAMAVVALLYGILSGNGVWYPVNLLAAMILPGITAANLHQFNLAALVVGLCVHGLISLSAGLLFALLLPTLPGWPIVWGGLVAPLLWTGGVYAFMGVLNPLMAQEVDWIWFVVSQFAFGLVVGLVVSMSEKTKTGPAPRDHSAPRGRQGSSQEEPG